MRGENVGFLPLVVAFTLPPLIRPGFAGPPSPEGEGFGAVEPGNCLRKSTGSAGACPRPTNGAFPLFKLLSRNEPGAPPEVVVYCQGNRLALSAATGRKGVVLFDFICCCVQRFGAGVCVCSGGAGVVS